MLSRGPSSSPAAPRSHPFPRKEAEGEVVTGISATIPQLSLADRKGGSVHPYILHPSYPQEAHQGHQEQGKQGVMAGGQSAEWGRDVESSWSLIQLRPEARAGHRRVGQPPALPELLVNWVLYSCTEGNEDGSHSKA